CTVHWTEESHEVRQPHDHCPCHVAEFDPYEGAKVLAGPAPRPLPQIGVMVNDNGELELTTKFEEGG
ncbi:MAG: ubiquinol-cytochrome c reductase iron-sulfur subunit, partial [Halobacteriaceae archaeon]